jgi:hypothetical protein
MSFVSSMLGGSTGAGFQAVSPTGAQLSTADQAVGNSIQQQQAFVNALQGQNGLANQTNVFGQQQGLANQLQGVANGTGPNPAQAMLAQATGQNVANQAALMAGQRGSGANVGLMARQAAQQGAATQQQAVGQGATMQAQQSLGAMSQLAAQQANMANTANTQVNQQQAGLTGLNQNTLQQQANLYGLQANANSANANIAGINAGGQQNILGGVMGGIGSAANLIGGMGGSSNLIQSGNGSVATSASGINPTNVIPTTNDLIGNGMGFAQGGEVKMADGGTPQPSAPMPTPTYGQVQTLDSPTPQGPQSNVGKMFNDSTTPMKSASATGQGANSMTSGMLGAGINLIKNIAENQGVKTVFNNIGNAFAGLGSTAGEAVAGAGDSISGGSAASSLGDAAVMVAAHGGLVPALLSPGERYLSPKDAKEVAKGKKDPMKAGEKIKGKPKVGGAKNSYANDTVPKTLEEGGIVLPRSVTMAKHPHWAAHKFVSEIMAQKHRKGK